MSRSLRKPRRQKAQKDQKDLKKGNNPLQPSAIGLETIGLQAWLQKMEQSITMETKIQQTSEHCQTRPNSEPRQPFRRLTKEEAQMNRLARKMSRARARRNKLAKDIGVLERYGIMKVLRERDTLAYQVGVLVLGLKEANRSLELMASQNKMQTILEALVSKLEGRVEIVEIHRDQSSLNNPSLNNLSLNNNQAS